MLMGVALLALAAVAGCAEGAENPVVAAESSTADVPTTRMTTTTVRRTTTTTTLATTTTPPTTAPPPPTAPPTTAPPPPPPPPSEPDTGGGCHPSYSPCVPYASDVDCAGGSGNGPAYTGTVSVVGPDVYGLDRDGDGVGCED